MRQRNVYLLPVLSLIRLPRPSSPPPHPLPSSPLLYNRLWLVLTTAWVNCTIVNTMHILGLMPHGMKPVHDMLLREDPERGPIAICFVKGR